MAAAYDGSIRINTRIDSAGARAELGSLTKSLKGFAIAVGVAFGVGAIISFGKSCIDLASDLSEVQNVIDTTFGSSVGLIEQFADIAATSFGLSELSAKQYTGTLGAMLKSMGFTEQAAADMSIEMASLAGDMASFYNLDPDTAFEKIRSGISGETEPLKQLGINLSVANLEAYALSQGITSSYNAMTEQNKALLRYNYLLSVTSDAQGDFAKTSNSWANQVRIMQLQWSSFKATLGGAFIQILTPVLQMLNLIIGRLNAAATVFASFISAITGTTQKVTTAATGATGAVNDLTDATDATGDAATKAGEAAKKAGKGLASFDELNTLSDSNGSSGATSPAADTTAADVAAVTESTTEATDSAVSEMEKKLKGFFTMYQDEISRVKGSWNELKGIVSGIWEELSEQFASVDIVGLSFEMIMNFIYALLEGMNLVIGVAGKLFVALNVPAIVQSALLYLSTLFKALGDVISAITPGIMAFVDKALVPIAEWIGQKIRDALNFFAEQLQKIGDWFTDHEEQFTVIIGFLGDIAALIWKIIEPLLDAVWEDTKTLISTMVDLILGLTGVIIDLVAWIIQLPIHFAQAWEMIKLAWGMAALWFSENIIMPVTEGFNSLWSALSAGATEAWNAVTTVWGIAAAWFNETIVSPIANFFGSLWVGIKAGASTLAGYISSYVISPVVEMFKGLHNSLASIMESMVNGFVKVVNSVIRNLNSMIDTINSLLDLRVPAIKPISTVSIPRLAQGAVIPPNREFMAILGDQKSGTNIETPLETMIAAFKTAIADMGGVGGNGDVYINASGSLAQFIRLISFELDKESTRKGVKLVT